MAKMEPINPFHEGELAAQSRAGVGDVAQWAGGFIRDYLPEQHREFHTNLPFLVVSGADAAGQVWITMIEGEDGFVTSPDPRSLTLDVTPDATDPLAAAFAKGTDIGVLGIELASRRRNRFSGYMQPVTGGMSIDIRQSFGNCPQYIHQRDWRRAEKAAQVEALHGTALSAAQIAAIGKADTMFIGSGHYGEEGAASNGFDASHRGGAPGFVHVRDARHLQIPDYAGNNFFNTIGNLVSGPRVGLLFVDFDTGTLLHVTGRAEIDWAPVDAHDPDAWRVITVEIDAVVERRAAVALRWARKDHLSQRLRVAKRMKESNTITSFYLEAADGREMKSFSAGQHLPIELQIPGQVGTSTRSYSLSGPPDETGQYRISVKREEKGLVSRFFHDQLREGSVIEAQPPAGDFVVPCSHCPLVLVSAGVGLTPMVSALHANAVQDGRDVWFVHVARNSDEHALRAEVDALIAGNERLKKRIFYSQPLAGDVLGRDYDRAGRLSAEELVALGAGRDARYMLCGPAAFLADIRTGLEAAAVPPDHILFETFGPATGNPETAKS